MSILNRVKKLLGIGPNVPTWVEQGPRRVTKIATKELLSDLITARHYQVGTFDAFGKKIELGKPFTFLDYREIFGPRVWYVYREGDMGFDKNDIPMLPGEEHGREIVRTEKRWLPAGVFENEAAARTFAESLR
jgi:hypothetical protein